MEQGKSYLLEQSGNSRYPRIDKVKCLRVTEKCYQLEWESNNTSWIYKDRIVEGSCFSPNYTIIEEVK